MSVAMILVFVGALLIGTPVAFVLGITGALGFLLFDPAMLRLIPQRMYAAVDSFPIMAAPFFILAGELVGASGILSRLLRFAAALVGHVRAGLAQVNIIVSMVFAGISGSAIADASALGTTMIPPMTKRYTADFAAAVTASSAVIGPIIPPSIPMVIYAFIVGQVSIGGLFLAGVVPGLLLGLGMMGIVFLIARKRGYKPEAKRAPIGEVALSFRDAGWALGMPVIILGGILGGVFTATEAGAVAAVYAIFVGRFVMRELQWHQVWEALARTATLTAVVFFLIATSNIVSWVLTVSMVPATLAVWLQELTSNPLLFLLIVNIFLLIVGFFLDNVAAMIMIAPILAPIALQYGIDPLHFGLIFVLNSVIGLLTPPVGAVLIVVSGIAKSPVERVSLECLPFLLWHIGVLLLVTYVPFVALALPSAFGYGR